MTMLRTIAKEASFDESCVRLFGSLQVADELVVRAIDWELARAPNFEAYPTLTVDHRDFHLLFTVSTGFAPACTVLFTLEGEKVVVIDINIGLAQD